MTFRDGLYRARGHIVFLLGLLVSFAIIIGLEGVEAEQVPAPLPYNDDVGMQSLMAEVQRAPKPAHAPLAPDQLEWAKLAWRYFDANIHPETGLPGSVDGFFGVTAWELGSFLNALVSAERLQIIPRQAFDGHLGKALASIARLPLYEGALPNKSYDIRTLSMTDYNGRPTETGIGWSALDIARLLIAFEIVSRGYPEHQPAISNIRQGWRLDQLLVDGLMFGRTPESPDLLQEGRLGYEEYAAKGLVMAGLDAFRALEVADTLRFADVTGVLVPVDGRHHGRFGGDVCTTSEPYLMDGLEFGFDTRSRAFAWAVLRAQEARAKASGIPTAVSEGHVPEAPFFVYGCVVGNDEPWAVLSPQGERFDQLRFLDTKSVFGWSALFPDEYTQHLLAQVFPLNDATKGWFTGRFESGGRTNGTITANTNAMVLESLYFRVFGPMLTRKEES